MFTSLPLSPPSPYNFFKYISVSDSSSSSAYSLPKASSKPLRVTFEIHQTMDAQKLRQYLRFSTIILTLSISLAFTMDLNNVKFIEQAPDCRLIATSNYNYGITNPKLAAKNWRTVSVNGDSVMIITSTGEKISTTKGQLDPSGMSLVESLREEILSGNAGSTQISSSTGGSSNGGNFMMSSSSSGNSFSSSTGGFSSVSTSGGQSSQMDDMSVSMKDENNYSVSKSGLPFNWSTVFVNQDLVTFVMKNGDVEMMPTNSIDSERLEAINKLKLEVKVMQKSQAQHLSNTMQHSMDMVSNVFSNVMGNFPKPPSYQSAVGNTFGDNFPFGSNNSPFSSSSGWPFSNGAFAGASAGRR